MGNLRFVYFKGWISIPSGVGAQISEVYSAVTSPARILKGMNLFNPWSLKGFSSYMLLLFLLRIDYNVFIAASSV